MYSRPQHARASARQLPCSLPPPALPQAGSHTRAGAVVCSVRQASAARGAAAAAAALHARTPIKDAAGSSRTCTACRRRLLTPCRHAYLLLLLLLQDVIEALTEVWEQEDVYS